MKPFYRDEHVTLYHADCLDLLAALPDNSVHAVVTDPPYGLEFMGREWDAPWKHGGAVVRDPAVERGGFQDGSGGNPYSRSRIEYGRGGGASIGYQHWCTKWARECLRVLRPGGHLVAFGGTRTYHRLAVAVEDAGFEVRDSIAWLYGSGFPKSLDVSKAIDKAAGAEREVIDRAKRTGKESGTYGAFAGDNLITTPTTDAAREWQGWGTALKPSFEPIVLARKPVGGTVAANVQAWGTGALNIDGGRVGNEVRPKRASTGKLVSNNSSMAGGNYSREVVGSAEGRWPTNVVLDDHAAAELDNQSGTTTSRRSVVTSKPGDIYGGGKGLPGHTGEYGYDDTGGASRFFPVFRWTPKADSSERPSDNGVGHPTVKPVSLVRWLCRLVCPPGGTVLEPFAGSGTTVQAARAEGFDVVAIERDADYLPLIKQRLERVGSPVNTSAWPGHVDQPGQSSLFDLLGGDAA